MVTQLIMLFALLFTGFGLYRVGIFNKTVDLGINKMVVFFAFPCMIMYKIGTMEMDPVFVRDFALVTVLGLASFFLYTGIAFAYFRMRGITARVSRPARLSAVVPNNGFIGYPVALVFLGQPGLLLMIAHGAIVLNVYAFSFGINYLRREKEERVPFTAGKLLTLVLQLVTNPVIISILAGLAILFFGISLDNVAGEYLSAISDMASPLAMIYVGAVIGEGEILKSFRDSTLWEISGLKLIVMPLVTALICMWLPLSTLVKAVLILGASFPCAAIPVMLGQQEGLDYEQAGSALLLSTILSVGTIPVVMKILTMILPL